MRKAFCAAACITLLIAGTSSSFALQVGDQAPLFEALSTKGKIKLEEYRGKNYVVLVFYVADSTPV